MLRRQRKLDQQRCFEWPTMAVNRQRNLLALLLVVKNLNSLDNKLLNILQYVVEGGIIKIPSDAAILRMSK